MRKIFVILMLVVAACSHNEEHIIDVDASSPVITEAQTIPAPAPAPIPKPRRLSPTDKNYTAPYPDLKSVQQVKTNSNRPGTFSETKTVVVDSGKDITKKEQRIVEIEVTRGAVSTQEFLGTKKRSVFEKKPVIVETTTAVKSPTVLDKAMKLPPKEIEEGKYRTFRRIEDDMAHDSRKMRGVIAEWIFPEMNDVVEKPVGKKQPEAFCYGSLSDSTCYSKPIKGQEFRRVGKVD